MDDPTTDANPHPKPSVDPKTRVPGNIRITSSGKITTYVTHALHYLQQTESGSPLILHTLPSESSASDSTSSTTCTKIIPRLISVVEILKREYIKILEDQGSSRLFGLHQYNQLGNLEDLEPFQKNTSPKEVETRQEMIHRKVDGSRTHLKQKQTPYMKITLSLSELPDLITQGATYQPALTRHLSKSAKTRAKKREKREQMTVEEQLGVEETA